MCGGGKTVTQTVAADPAPVNVTDAGGSQSAARTAAKKEKQRRGLTSNMLSQDRSILSSAMGDSSTKNVLG